MEVVYGEKKISIDREENKRLQTEMIYVTTLKGKELKQANQSNTDKVVFCQSSLWLPTCCFPLLYKTEIKQRIYVFLLVRWCQLCGYDALHLLKECGRAQTSPLPDTANVSCTRRCPRGNRLVKMDVNTRSKESHACLDFSRFWDHL